MIEVQGIQAEEIQASEKINIRFTIISSHDNPIFLFMINFTRINDHHDT